MELMHELKDVPCHEIGKQIIDKIGSYHKTNLYEQVTSTEISERERIDLIRKSVTTYVFANYREIIKQFDGKYDEKAEKDHIDKILGQDPDPLVNWIYTPDDLEAIRSFRGDEVLTYLKTTSQRFGILAEGGQDVFQMALQLTAAGLIGLTMRGGKAAVAAYTAGTATTYTAAAMVGINSIGLVAFAAVVVLAVVTFLLWFLFDNQKNVFGLVVNESQSDLVVTKYRSDGGALYVKHGKMEHFMEDQESQSSPWLQIKSSIKDTSSEPPTKYCFGGPYFADKTSGSAFGAEGLIAFDPVGGGPRIALMYCCPYHRDNGTFMSIIDGGTNLSDEYGANYDDRVRDFFLDENGITLQSSINDKRGGNVGNIAFINFPS